MEQVGAQHEEKLRGRSLKPTVFLEITWNYIPCPQTIMDTFPLVRKSLDTITEENTAEG